MNNTKTRTLESTWNRTALWLAAGLAFGALLATPPVRAQVTLKINNQSGQPVCVMWTGTTARTGTSNGISIAPSDSGVNAAGYALSGFAQAAPNVAQINGFTMGGGRMWFTYGNSCWSIPSTGYTPSLANFNDPNFPLRYDKIEAYIMGSTDDNLDITAVDAFAIPFSVKAYVAASPSTTTQTLKGSRGGLVIPALSAIAANAKAADTISPAGAGTPLPHITGNSPYLVINSNSQGTATAAPYTDSPFGSSGSFARVIANDNLIATYAGDLVAVANGNQVPDNYSWTTYNNYIMRMDGRAASPYTGATSSSGISRDSPLPPAPRRHRRATASRRRSIRPSSARLLTPFPAAAPAPAPTRSTSRAS